MTRKYKNGHTEVIQNVECHVPPPGYVFNVLSGRLERREIISRSDKKKDQYWEREPFPSEYEELRREEIRIQKSDPTFRDLTLARYIRREWDRRLNGVWFMNNGKPTYLTGLHYFMLQWVPVKAPKNMGYADYRDPQRKLFYVWQYCVESPDVLGLIWVTKRRFLKTYIGGSILLEYASRAKGAVCGIQSKTDDDAEAVFRKSIIEPFKELPYFFRPIWDSNRSLNSMDELRFFRPSRRGKAAAEDMGKDELKSRIDYKSSELYAYDGQPLHRYLADEVGKTKEVDVYKRHNVTRFCSELDGEFIGKQFFTTTVEQMDNANDEAFPELWADSDQSQLNANGRTKTGLYRFFTSAQETLFFDKYGFADEVKAMEYYLAEQEMYRNDPKKLAELKRKNPITIDDAFRMDGAGCLYDAVRINDQLDKISWRDDVYVQGNLMWKDDIKDSEAVFVPSKTGRWKLVYDPMDRANNFIKRGDYFYPNKNSTFTGGVDPFDIDTTESGKGSSGAIYVYRKQDSWHPEYNNTFVCQYVARPPTVDMFAEDLILTAAYFGAPMLVETNKAGSIRKYVTERGWLPFLIHFEGKVNPGISSTAESKEEMVRATEYYIHNYCENVWFKELLRDWIKFDVRKTEKYDMAMAAGWALIGAGGVVARLLQNKKAKPTMDVKKLFPKYKIRQW